MVIDCFSRRYGNFRLNVALGKKFQVGEYAGYLLKYDLEEDESRSVFWGENGTLKFREDSDWNTGYYNQIVRKHWKEIKESYKLKGGE